MVKIVNGSQNNDWVDHLSKYYKLTTKIEKFCKKHDISIKKDIEYNDDIHFQFWKTIENWPGETAGTKYTECWVSKNDIVGGSIWKIVWDLKGFIRTYFKLPRWPK